MSDQVTPEPTFSGDIEAQGFRAAATALPKFGSITQSSNVDSTGRTTDRASATHDGTTVEITVTQADGSTFTFDSDEPAWLSGTIDPSEPFVPAGQTDVRYSYHVDWTGDSFFASYIERGWGDSGNWYAGGYWIRADDNPYLSTTAVELGAYSDSPEIDSSSPPSLPDAGSATYAGGAQGVYYHDYADGSREIGQYIGDMSLTVDFATGRVDYCTGCTKPTLLYGHYVALDGTSESFDEAPNGLMYRASAVVGANGRFESTTATLSRIAGDPRPAVVHDEGTFGGVFSNIPDSDGNPRAVMGTMGSEYLFSDSSGGAWVGTYIGTTK